MDIHLTSDILSKYSSFDEWVTQTGIEAPSSAIVRGGIESDLIRQATYFALLQFWQHEQTDIWGEVGEDASRLSFLRIILGLEEDLSVNSIHIERFNTQLHHLYDEFHISEVPIDSIKDRLAEYRFRLAGNEYQLHDSEWINRLLEFVGSTLCIQSGDYGHERELILGHGKTFHFDEYRVVDLTNEVMRTANMVTSLAAAIGHNQIFVRHAALQGIFQLKWESFMAYPHIYHHSPEYEAGHQLKKLTCASYAIDSTEDLGNRRTEFLNDMRENILFHELGHAVIQHRLLPSHIATFSEASKIINHPLIHSLLELLAEIAPQNGGILGPLWNIVQVAKVRPERAMRMFWMYVSDTWFFDTPDDYMYFYSDLVAVTFGAAIHADGTLNLDHFESVVWGQDGILDQMTTMVSRLCQSIMDEMETVSYVIEDQSMSFVDAREWVKGKLEEENTQEANEYLHQTALWHQLLNSALQDADFEKKVVQMLERRTPEVMGLLAEKAGLPTGTSGSPRQQVIERILNAGRRVR